MKLLINICGPDTSKAAAALFRKHRDDLPPSCTMGCSTMDVTIMAAASYKNLRRGNFAEVKFRFKEKIKIYQEVESYEFLDLVADLGGYLGLTLGLSLLDITGPLNNIITNTAGYFGRTRIDRTA